MTNSTFSFTSPSRQYFLLPYSLICYITERPSSSALGYQKLQQTCKYFFAKKKLIIMDTSVTDHRGKLHYIGEDSQDIYFLPEIQYWLTYGLYHRITKTFIRDGLYRCDLKNLLLQNVILSYNDIDFLLISKRLDEVGWFNVTITNNDSNKPFTIVDLISKLPNINVFHYRQKDRENLTEEIIEKINSLNFNDKFFEFVVDTFKFDDEMDPSVLCNFIKKNTSPRGADIHFYDNTTEDGYHKLEAAVQKMLQEWPKQNRKPKVSFSTFW